jgi:hypothetical protein
MGNIFSMFLYADAKPIHAASCYPASSGSGPSQHIFSDLVYTL